MNLNEAIKKAVEMKADGYDTNWIIAVLRACKKQKREMWRAFRIHCNQRSLTNNCFESDDWPKCKLLRNCSLLKTRASKGKQ